MFEILRKNHMRVVKEDTVISIITGNIKPSKIEIKYLDID